MNQPVSHSNTPAFDVVESQTTAILYQQPTHEEMHSKPVNIFKNLCAGLLIFILFFVMAYIAVVADDNVAVKQMQLVESKTSS
jgi:hypothetical protein